MNSKPVIIVGAGLAGSLMSIYLAKKGFSVEIFENRKDMRTTDISAGRSINLALSDRGILPLQEVGVDQKVLGEAVKMPGRMLHAVDGSLKFAPYGKDDSQYINSISRGGLNQLLMTEAESYENVSIHFNQNCIDVDFDNTSITVEDYISKERKTISGCTIIGADGANSSVRNALKAKYEGYQSDVEWLEHGYKELTIPPAKEGSFALEKNALHIWPRGNYMLIALPNSDGSFTCTLFFPIKGEFSFESLDSADKVDSFFKEQFADAMPHLNNLQQEFANNPVGKLGTLKCFPWVLNHASALIGDAAHAVVPFYGQGMNASFEDCRILNECIDKYGPGNWDDAYKEYENLRKINGDAIGVLAVENFYEMRDHVANPVFRKKRQLEHQLENDFEDYHSKYSLVTFQPQIPYSIALSLGNKQDALLMNICKNTSDLSTLDIEAIYHQLKALKNG